MINWIKRDFSSVREAWGYLLHREIPIGIAILYYVIIGCITIPLTPLIWVINKIYMKILLWDLRRGH
jgi:hypothetical protein